MAINRLLGMTRWALGIWIVMSLGATLLAAEDSPRQHLDRLRADDRYEAAIEYLEQLQAMPDAQRDLEDVVLFELGSTLVDAAHGDREPIRRRTRLDKAAASLRAFIEQQPKHALVSSARDKLGYVLVEMARLAFEQAKQTGVDKLGNESLLQEARRHYREATSAFQANQTDLRDKLADMPKVLNPQDPDQRKLLELRQQYRADYLQVCLFLPAIAEEQADTYPNDAEDRAELFQAAAADYEQIYHKYRTRLAGLYAHMYQGRCYVKLSQYERALKVFDELLAQPNSPEAFWMLKQRVAVLAAECWLDETQKNYQRAISQLGELLENLDAEQTKMPGALDVRLALAKAHQRYAEQLAKDSPDDPRVAESRQQAVKLARFVASQSARHRAAASDLLFKLDAKDPLEHVEIGELKTFAELSLLGQQSMTRWQLAMVDSQKLTAKLESETDATIKDDLRKRLDQTNNHARDAQDTALAAYQRALEVMEDEPVEKVNQIRYFTCYLLYTKGEFRQAAELGARLARKHPTGGSAQQSAQIAFASYLQLHNRSTSDKERTRTRKKLRDFGEFILKHWADQSVGEDVRKALKGLD